VNAFAHVIAKGNRGAVIYPRNFDYAFFLGCLAGAAAAHAVRVHAYCLMPNHVHLLVEATTRPLSAFMKVLLQRHAQYINRLYHHRGHVFGDRFWSRVCRSDLDALASLRYIHLNPVVAGLVKRPAQYPWSSHRVYLGQAEASWVTTALLESFTADPVQAADVYRWFVEVGEAPTRPPDRSAGAGGTGDPGLS